MKFKLFIPTLLTAAAILHGCDSVNDGVSILDTRPDATRPVSSAQVDVFRDNIAAALASPDTPASDSVSLFTNSGFEDGVNGWTACVDGAISASTDAYEGEGALQLNAGNCLYRSVSVSPGESYALSCFIKLTTERAWTGMGMIFADGSYNSLLEAPVAVATSGDYMRLDTQGMAPEGTSLLSMWIHSDFGAAVDNCSLTLQANKTPRPTPTEPNLLSNGTFIEDDGQGGAADWTTGCHGTVVKDESSLFLSDGACVDQALSAQAIDAVASSKITYSCLVTEAQGYSDLSVFLDDKLQGFQRINASHKNTRIALEVDAAQPGNGFVSLFSNGHLRVEDCQLISDGIADGNTDTDAATDTDGSEDTSTNTDADTVPVTDADTTDTDTTPATDAVAAPVTDADTDVTPVVRSARYRLTFNATWSSQTHPTNYPPPAHFSGLVGAVHNDSVAFWAPGQEATDGIQLMAETGDGSLLLSEVASAVANGTAAAEIAGGGIADTPGSVSIEFEVTTEHPLITVTSMVAPSPDWFIGVHGLSLFDGTDFVESVTRNLSVYDSGTDSGARFIADNLVTLPQAPISLLTSAQADTDIQNGLPSMGEFVIQKLSDTAEGADIDTGSDTTTDAGVDPATDTSTDTTPDNEVVPTVTSARYRLTFDATWSSQTHPTNYPPPAHFSGLVGAVHSDSVAFWAPGQQATDGIQLMAETGDGSLLLSEVATAVANGTAAAEIAGGGIADTPGSVSIEFEVTTEHPLITVTSMVAPSPDWFVGVHGLSLFDGTDFVESVTQNLFVYDSGTDSGARFIADNLVTLPQAPISLVNSAPADTDIQNGLPSMGRFIIQKLP